MRRTGLALICGVLVVTALFGCRTREPNLKPASQPPQFVLPPDDPRYNTPQMPKEAIKSRPNPLAEPLGNPQGPPGGAFTPGGGFGGPTPTRGY